MTATPRRRLLAGAVGLVLLGCGGTAAAADAPVSLHGAGASFPAPLYYKWMETYAKDHAGVRLSYDSVGSGDGIARFLAQSVDFAASDAPLGEKDAGRITRGAVLVPATGGMIALAYNIPGLAAPLKLPRDVYVDILLGKIRKWSDARVLAANPGAKLPDRTIAVVGRLDRSGTTFAFTNHLSAISEAWRAGPGLGTWVEWPRNAMLARGNEGVASRIKISEYSIGYVEYGFAKRLGLAMAQLQNKAGNFISPDEKSGASALAESVAGQGDGFRPHVTDPAGDAAYPIVTFTWILLYQQYPDAQKRAALKDFVDWGLTAGQAHGPTLGYIPLPENVVARGRAALTTLR